MWIICEFVFREKQIKVIFCLFWLFIFWITVEKWHNLPDRSWKESENCIISLPSHSSWSILADWSLPGALNVKLLDNSGYESLLWTRSGAHGNMWHEAHCPVPHQLTNFQVWNDCSQPEMTKQCPRASCIFQWCGGRYSERGFNRMVWDFWEFLPPCGKTKYHCSFKQIFLDRLNLVVVKNLTIILRSVRLSLSDLWPPSSWCLKRFALVLMGAWPLTMWSSWTARAPWQGCVPLKASAVGTTALVKFTGFIAAGAPPQQLDPKLTTLWRLNWVRENPIKEE